MYSVKNISNNPARPIGLMVGGGGKGGAINVKNHLMVSTDGVPVPLTDEQYEYAKHAIKKYEDADMLVCKKLKTEKPAADKPKDDDPDAEETKRKEKERKDEIAAIMKEKFGVDAEKRKKLETLEAELKALEDAAKSG